MTSPLLVAVFILGQAHAPVPPWVDSALSKLKSEGLLYEYPVLCRPVDTRYERAVATHCAFTLLKLEVGQAKQKPLTTVVRELLLKRSKWVPATLIGLMDEFRPELTMMQANVPACICEITNLKAEMQNLAREGSVANRTAPKAWVMRELGRLKKEGLLMGYPDGLGHPRYPPTRYEFAVAVNATVEYLGALLADAQKRGLTVEDRKWLRSSVWATESLHALVKEYRVEIKTLEGHPDPEALMRRCSVIKQLILHL